MAVVASGLGSGIDISSIVSQLVDAERVPTTNRLDLKEAGLQAKITAYGALKGALSSFNSTLSSLSSLSTFQSVSATSSDTDQLTATASSTAASSIYNITLNNLAEAHTLVTADGDYSAITDDVGGLASTTGTLTFKFGTTDYTPGSDTYTSFTPNAEKSSKSVTIDSSNNTLAGVRDAVNSADIGVRASIVFDGGDYRLTFTSEDTGLNNSLQITVDDGDGTDADTSGLSRLAYNGTATNLTETVAAADAVLKINGLDITSSSNTITDAISGVTLNLLSADAATPFTLNVKQDTSVVSNAVNNFVTGYNSLVNTISDIASYDADTQQAGILLGDSTTRSVISQLRSTLNSALDSLSSTSASFSTLGITTNSDGTLAIDQSKLSAAVASDVGAVSSLFALSGALTSSQLTYVSATSDTRAGDYAVSISSAATKGVFTGTTFGYSGTITIDADSDGFGISVDGVQSDTITLTQSAYTGAALAIELQTRINGDTKLQAAGVSVSVAFDAGAETFSITSDRYGDASKVQFTSLDTDVTSDFGVSSGSGVTGTNVVGTIGGFAATGSGRVLTGASGVVKGLKLELQSDSTGSFGTVSFTRGIADQLNTVVSNMLDSDGAIEARIDGANADIDDINSSREALATRLESVQSRLLAQFIAMDSLISQLQGTGNFLEQQLSGLSNIGDFVNR
ncbi:MAG: flagellar filament capping protein FliD [Gammaproteobacteria bacterium]|nr:flagellar filament capping protein FliD [Gammaproteobacteria bacterium]